jgi:hypothetical protein
MSAPAVAEPLERGHLELDEDASRGEPRDGGGGGETPPAPPPPDRRRGYGGGRRLPRWQRVLIWVVFTALGMILAAALGWMIGGASSKCAIAAERLIAEARG